MADLQVIYDPALEVAAIVDLDNRIGFGPIMVGPGARELLDGFLTSTPFDLDGASSELVRGFFDGFLARIAGPDVETPSEAPERPLEPVGDQGMADSRLAQREASDARGEPPTAAPADTDMAGDQGAAAPVMVCPLCGGDKIVWAGDPPESSPCGMCKGVGVVSLAVVP